MAGTAGRRSDRDAQRRRAHHFYPSHHRKTGSRRGPRDSISGNDASYFGNLLSRGETPMNAPVQFHDLTPRSLVEERAPRPPTIGKIRPGIKVLTRAAQSNEKAVKLYGEM